MGVVVEMTVYKLSYVDPVGGSGEDERMLTDSPSWKQDTMRLLNLLPSQGKLVPGKMLLMRKWFS